MENPKNQHQLALWYLYYYNDFDLKFVINDSMFFKFQTRLSEIECRSMTKIAKRTPKQFVNRFGRKSTYFLYSALDKQKLIKLFKDYG
jgi:hypothetical protein